MFDKLIIEFLGYSVIFNTDLISNILLQVYVISFSILALYVPIATTTMIFSAAMTGHGQAIPKGEIFLACACGTTIAKNFKGMVGGGCDIVLSYDVSHATATLLAMQ